MKRFVFIPRAQPQLRVHPYSLFKQRCSSSVLRTSFSSRAINMWNYLPVYTTNFSSLNNFNKTVYTAYLLTFCKVNLA